MGPVTIHILPDLLDLDAWAFVMAFGNASTTVGASMASPGFVLDGLSLAFGAGVDVHWAAGPFSFDAHGIGVLAVLTHKPQLPDGTHPWMLAGLAEIRGSVDLGPVSIGASAHLDVLVQDHPQTLYARAEACASVDLWLVEIEGCVDFDIGSKPPLVVPAPESPFEAMHLTDRRGLVIETVPAGGPAPTVWADAIPALTFSHYVAAAPAVAGLRQPIGDWVPDGGGWVGTASSSTASSCAPFTSSSGCPPGPRATSAAAGTRPGSSRSARTSGARRPSPRRPARSRSGSSTRSTGSSPRR